VCSPQRLTFTRARPYRKNDNCYVEQKNYSVVRQTVGYQRFDTTAELMVLQQLYGTLRLYSNFFQPTMKLKSKERFGSRVKKSYHAPQTPYQRVLACAEVTLADKKKLQRQYRLLNPAALKRELDKQRKELFRLASKKRPLKLKRQRNQRELQIKPQLGLNTLCFRVDFYMRQQGWARCPGTVLENVSLNLRRLLEPIS
jgi:hypothetical protein